MGKPRPFLCKPFRNHAWSSEFGDCVRCGLAQIGTPKREVQNFWRMVDRCGPDECWPWIGSILSHGYGQFGFQGKMRRAHMVSYYLAHGECPAWGSKMRVVVMHTCDRKECVNPAHLILGTQGQNMNDMVRKGRKSGTLLTPDRVRTVRRLKEAGLSRGEIARRVGVNAHAVYMAASGRSWKAVD